MDDLIFSFIEYSYYSYYTVGMPEKQSLLHKSFSILRSVSHLILATYFLNTLSSLSFWDEFLWIKVIIFLPCKIFVYAGIWGSLVEVVSGQQILVTLDVFKENAKRYWKHYLLVVSLPLVASIIFSLLVNPLNIFEMTIINRICNIFVLLVLAKWIILSKYTKGIDPQAGAIKIKWKDMAAVTSVYIIDILVIFIAFLWDIGHFDLQNLFGFFSEVIQYLEFIMLTILALMPYPSAREKFRHDHELYLISPYPHPSPKIFGIVTSAFQTWYPPIFFIMKTYTPSQYKIREFNYTPWYSRYFRKDKLVAITCTTANCAEAYRIAKGFKAAGSKVVMGGPHVSFVPEEALDFCDSVVVGEVEGVWEEVLSDYEAGTLKRKYSGIPLDRFYAKVHEAYMRMDEWNTKFILENVRGCKYCCDFCVVHPLNGPGLRKKPIPQVIELVKKVKHKTNKISFMDNNIFNDPQYAKSLFRALIPLHMRWNAFSSADIGDDPEALELAKQSGCNMLVVGFEVNQNSEEVKRGGKFKYADHYAKLAHAIQKKGIKTNNAFLYGFDSDKLSDLFRLWRFCFEIRSGDTNLGIVTPFPGTAFYYRLLREKRMENLNWKKYNALNVVFRPKNMNKDLLQLVFPFIRNFFYYSTSNLAYAILIALIFLAIVF